EDDDNDDELLPHDWTDAAADRGYTDDDVLAEAKEDAGLLEGSEAASAPDPALAEEAHTRPFLTPAVPPPAHHAPSASAAAAAGDGADARAKKKRRRRGGRGRNKKPASATAATAAGGAPAHVEGVLDYGSEDGASVLDSLDEATLER